MGSIPIGCACVINYMLGDFLSDCILKCQQNDINFKLLNRRSHQGCGGFFDEKNLVSCTQRVGWVGILVHESCHLDQFLEKIPLWDEYQSRGNSREERIKLTLKLEIDCERRALKKIKRLA